MAALEFSIGRWRIGLEAQEIGGNIGGRDGRNGDGLGVKVVWLSSGRKGG